MGDYPDYTDLMQIIGSDIQVPIDIQGAFIQMPVDIQAQYITLDIDIVAQSVGNLTIDIAAQTIGNLAVNLAASAITLNVKLAASAVTLNVDITAQTVGNLNFDIKAQSVGIYSQPEWAAKIGTDKNFKATAANIGFGSSGIGTYTVPTGKTLYLCGLSFAIRAYAEANGDLNQIGRAILENLTDAISLAELGGNGGNGVVFSKPIPVATGKQIRYGVVVYANHTCNIYVTAWGYEV